MWICPDGTGFPKKLLTTAEREKFSGFSFPPALQSCQNFLLSKTSWRPAATRAWETWSAGVSPAVQGKAVGRADSRLATGQPGNTSKTANLPQSEISKRSQGQLWERGKPKDQRPGKSDQSRAEGEGWELGRGQPLVWTVTCPWLTLTGPSAAP